MQKFGIDNAITTAHKLGITSVKSNNNYGLALALGEAEAPLLQMTNAYAAFANGGQQYTPTTIVQINNKYGDAIFTTHQVSKQAISAQGAYLISSILSDNSARAPIFGSSLNVPGHTAAVKTGTTNDNRDAWTIGYTPQLALGIWVGNNNNDAMRSGGSDMAGPIWVKTMKQALADTPNAPFIIPAGVIQKPVCSGTGALSSSAGSGTYNEYFLSSALPTTTCSPKKTTPPPVEEQPVETTPATCPNGQTGTPPNCVTPTATCPSGQTGTPPDCKAAQSDSCPVGTVGVPPDCTAATKPSTGP
jgi:penicillin-binding protein 1A